MKKITAVVMCSGFGKRMGTNKLFMYVDDKRMFEYVLDLLVKIRFSKIIVVTPYEEIQDYARDLGYIVADNIQNDEGIAASVRIGTQMSEDSDGIMFFTADQPFIDKQSVLELMTDFDRNDKITVPMVNGFSKNPVIFPIRYKNDLISLKGDKGGKQIVKINKDDVSGVYFDCEYPFFDIDTVDDLIRIDWSDKFFQKKG